MQETSFHFPWVAQDNFETRFVAENWIRTDKRNLDRIRFYKSAIESLSFPLTNENDIIFYTFLIPFHFIFPAPLSLSLSTSFSFIFGRQIATSYWYFSSPFRIIFLFRSHCDCNFNHFFTNSITIRWNQVL